jgi:formylmethanofuran dehydrogenase subunit B
LNVRCAARFGRWRAHSDTRAMSLNVVQHATCTFCGCVCDDIELHADGDRILKAKNACSLGESWFKHHTAERLYPDALVDGKPATVDQAVEVAAEFLHDAHMPLVYGLSNITCEAQREAVALAELIGGVVDSHTSL